MENKKAVAWRVKFTLTGSSGSNFTKIYTDAAEKDKWVRLHELAGFDVEVSPLYE